MPKKKNTGSTRTAAIIGGGPAGAALAALLARQGWKTAVFHTDKRPPLIVGESLLPAVVPLLQLLGIEQKVKSFSIFKPGATICLSLDEVITAPFTYAQGKLPAYAYNCPRDQFDQAVLDAAQDAGAAIFCAAAKLEPGDEPDTVRLSDQTLQATGGFFADQPDMVVDATGRNRLIPKVLEHSAVRGGRNDVALFAHLDNATIHDAGHIHLNYLSRGWAWRIPLPGRVSVGIVIDPAHLKQYGAASEQQYDGFLADEPTLRALCGSGKRITPVVKYQNYQLVAERMFGKNWMLVGDSAGFVDPVFSPGVYLALKSAVTACKAMTRNTPKAMLKYQNDMAREFHYWTLVVDSWYDGKLFNLYRAGQKMMDKPMGALMHKRVRRRLAQILTGETASDKKAMLVFQSLIAFGAVMRDPADLIVQ